jgi:hypothetical protein
MPEEKSTHHTQLEIARFSYGSYGIVKAVAD